MKSDLTTSADVVRLVDTFYERVRADERLGPIFDGVARVDWATHLPRMYAFWESALFGAPGFRGDPLAVHAALAQRVPLTTVEFDRWLELFSASVDELFAGPGASGAKARAGRIAQVMLDRIAAAGPDRADRYARRLL